MTIGEQLLKIQDDFKPWVDRQSGSVEPARDYLDFLAALFLKPGAIRVSILFNGEVPRDKDEDASGLGRVDRSYLIGVSRGKAMTLEAADGLTRTTGAGAPLFDLVEQAREVARAIKFDPLTTEVMPGYRGIRRIEVDGYLVDAYTVEITIGSQNPEHREDTEPDPVYPQE